MNKDSSQDEVTGAEFNLLPESTRKENLGNNGSQKIEK